MEGQLSSLNGVKVCKIENIGGLFQIMPETFLGDSYLKRYLQSC
jgi:hypothetical protein